MRRARRRGQRPDLALQLRGRAAAASSRCDGRVATRARVGAAVVGARSTPAASSAAPAPASTTTSASSRTASTAAARRRGGATRRLRPSRSARRPARPARPPASAGSGALLPPSRAHGSSNSTRHLPSSLCCSASFARNDRPLRPLKPVTGLAVRPVAMSSRATASGSVLPAFAFQMTKPQPGILARPAREALAVLDDVVAADRARTEVRARDADVLELGVELGDRRLGEALDVGHEALARLLAALDHAQPLLPVAGHRRRRQRVLAEQADDVQALLGRHERARRRARRSRRR